MARIVGYQAITTKFLGATNSRGSRVKATAEAGSLTVSWDYGLDATANHEIVAQALADRFGWKGEIVGAATPNSSGYVFVFTGK